MARACRRPYRPLSPNPPAPRGAARHRSSPPLCWRTEKGGPLGRPFSLLLSRSRSGSSGLLDLDGAAGLFDLGLQLLGLVLVDAFLDGLGSLVDERLGLLEAQAGGRANDLDDLDLLVAGRRQDDVERGLLLGRLGRVAAAAAADRRRNADRRRGDAEGLLE